MNKINLNTLTVLDQIYFPYTIFFLDISDSEYMSLQLGEPIILTFKIGKDKYSPYGLLADTQTLERGIGTRIKLQFYGRSRVRLIRNSNNSLIEYVRIEDKIDDGCLNDIQMLLEVIKKSVSELDSQKLTSVVALRDKLIGFYGVLTKAIQQSDNNQIITIVYNLASFLLKSKNHRLRILCMRFSSIIHAMISCVSHAVQKIIIDQKIQKELAIKLENQQKEFILHERIKLLQKELDKNNSKTSFSTKWFKSPEKFKAFVKREMKTFEGMNRMSPEYGQQKRLLEYATSLPWTSSNRNINVDKVRELLDNEHFGLEKVKDRISDFIYSYNLNPSESKVLCFVGSPGIGKTSIAKSIAKVISRDFVKISLAGCGDSAYLLGSSRVYVNSQPGILVSNLSKLNHNDPVILLDEIDKTISKYQQGASAVEYALLDILDKENNVNFKDHFLDETYSLANIFFICTANSLSDIPWPLLDRLEIIWLDAYSINEKINIANNFLIPKIIKRWNIKESPKITNEILSFIIERITFEGGVRNLNKLLERLIIAWLREKIKRINLKEVSKLFSLEIRPYDTGTSQRKFHMYAGRALGMFVSSGIGGILPVDVRLINLPEQKLKGLPKINVTGNLSKVMSESASVSLDAAMCYLESVDDKQALSVLSKANIISIHYGSNAISKDGPSAGLATTLAIVSAAKNKPLPYWCLTGEINSFGEVSIIGGLKEKIMGAKINEAEAVVFPKANARDFEEINNKIEIELKSIKIYMVDSIFEIAKEIWS